MIPVWINIPWFEYDIHSLVKAFFPSEEVKVFCMGQGKEDREGDSKGKGYSGIGGNGAAAGGDSGIQAAGGEISICICFLENEITMELLNGCLVRPESMLGKEGEASLPGAGAVREMGQCIRTQYPKGAARAEIKNVLKRLVYMGLSKYLGKELPWGTLTGIRPTKIPMAMLEEGRTEEEILRHMEQAYFISEEKGVLSLEIARREKDILSSLHYRDGYSLYIGIPFCPTTCLYCSFTSYPIAAWQGRAGEYLDALEKELAYVADVYRGRILDTVYIGGGTPTTLGPEQLERLFRMVYKYFDMEGIQEFTVEAGRADSITREKLCVLKEYGVTRISVNPQTMKEETLRLIGRRHTVGQVRDAFALAREEGFDNINMDIILGLPAETEEDVNRTVQEIKKLSPDSLTVHSLAIKRASALSQWIEKNGIQELRNTEATMNIAAGAAADMGMAPYYLYRQKNMSGNFENVGYARQGKYGIYNILIMEEKQTIVACGAGSVSKRVYPDGRIERSENVKDVAQYIERIGEMIERKKHLLSDC